MRAAWENRAELSERLHEYFDLEEEYPDWLGIDFVRAVPEASTVMDEGQHSIGLQDERDLVKEFERMEV